MKKLLGLAFLTCAAFSLTSYANVNANPLAAFQFSAPTDTCPLQMPTFCDCWTKAIVQGCIQDGYPAAICTPIWIVHHVGVTQAAINATCQRENRGNPAAITECENSFGSYVLGTPAHGNNDKTPCPQW